MRSRRACSTARPRRAFTASWARLGLPRWHDALAIRAGGGRLAVLDGLDEFREHLGGDLTVTLVRGIGQALEVHDMDGALVEKAIAWMRGAAATP